MPGLFPAFTRVTATLTAFATAAALASVAACGKPAAPDGGDDDFVKASLGGTSQPLVDGKALELIGWLVQFNRLQSPEDLESMLNKEPGKFLSIDTNGDGQHDYIVVSTDPEPKRGDKGLVLHARPSGDEDAEPTTLANLHFNEDWALIGYTRRSRPVAPLSATAKAHAVASAASMSAAHQQQQRPALADLADAKGNPDNAPGNPVAEAAPAVMAVPAGSDAAAGLAAMP